MPAALLIFYLFCGLVKAGCEKESETSLPALEFIKSYRYSSIPQKKVNEFYEVKLMAKALARLYFDFASMGSKHFAEHPVDFLSERLTGLGLIQVFLIFSDRLTRHMAYVSQLYEIEIKSGLAIDPFDTFLKK